MKKAMQFARSAVRGAGRVIRKGASAIALAGSVAVAGATDPVTFDVSTMTDAVDAGKSGASTILVAVAGVWALFILAKLAKRAGGKA